MAALAPPITPLVPQITLSFGRYVLHPLTHNLPALGLQENQYQGQHTLARIFPILHQLSRPGDNASDMNLDHIHNG